MTLSFSIPPQFFSITFPKGKQVAKEFHWTCACVTKRFFLVPQQLHAIECDLLHILPAPTNQATKPTIPHLHPKALAKHTHTTRSVQEELGKEMLNPVIQPRRSRLFVPLYRVYGTCLPACFGGEGITNDTPVSQRRGAVYLNERRSPLASEWGEDRIAKKNEMLQPLVRARTRKTGLWWWWWIDERNEEQQVRRGPVRVALSGILQLTLTA